MPRSAGFVGFYVRMAGCVCINPGSWPRYAKGYRGAEAGPRSGQRREVEVLLARFGGLRRLLGVYDQRHELEDLVASRGQGSPRLLPRLCPPGAGRVLPGRRWRGSRVGRPMRGPVVVDGDGVWVGGQLPSLTPPVSPGGGGVERDLVSPPKTRSPPRCGRTRPPGAVAPPSLLCAQGHIFGPCRSTELNTHTQSAKARTRTHTKNTHTYRDTNTQCHCMPHKQTQPTM